MKTLKKRRSNPCLLGVVICQKKLRAKKRETDGQLLLHRRQIQCKILEECLPLNQMALSKEMEMDLVLKMTSQSQEKLSQTNRKVLFQVGQPVSWYKIIKKKKDTVAGVTLSRRRRKVKDVAMAVVEEKTMAAVEETEEAAVEKVQEEAAIIM